MRLTLSIDFEDMAHDMRRDLGLWETGPLRIEALWASYHAIDAFLARHSGVAGRRATFFTTGVIADQAPDLVARIAGDGHEVACHYHYHDRMRDQDIATVDRMLGRARAALEDAANVPVRGFRAPGFRIDRRAPDQYRAVARHFAYDSSLPAGSPAEVAAFRAQMGLGDFPILPIWRGRIAGAPMRMGGSWLKLFPAGLTAMMIARARAAGMAPHLYIHPYEFAAHGAYRLDAATLAPLGRRRAGYWRLRQEQWHGPGAAGLPRKLAGLIGAEGLTGRLDRSLGL